MSDHVISSDGEGVLYVLNCSASSEDYIYLRELRPGALLRLTYHDDYWVLNTPQNNFGSLVSFSIILANDRIEAAVFFISSIVAPERLASVGPNFQGDSDIAEAIMIRRETVEG
ncbi:MAG TPA: hypothetical protein VGK01_00820 [Candidatus Angelobacter sp.]|jgi:hypothetical protein